MLTINKFIESFKEINFPQSFIKEIKKINLQQFKSFVNEQKKLIGLCFAITSIATLIFYQILRKKPSKNPIQNEVKKEDKKEQKNDLSELSTSNFPSHLFNLILMNPVLDQTDRNHFAESLPGLDQKLKSNPLLTYGKRIYYSQFIRQTEELFGKEKALYNIDRQSVPMGSINHDDFIMDFIKIAVESDIEAAIEAVEKIGNKENKIKAQIFIQEHIEKIKMKRFFEKDLNKEKAIEFLENSLMELDKRKKRQEGLFPSCYVDIALAYAIYDSEKAIEIIEDNASEHSDANLRCEALRTIALIQLLSNHETALKTIEKISSTNSYIGDKALADCAILLVSKGRFDVAIIFADKVNDESLKSKAWKEIIIGSVKKEENFDFEKFKEQFKQNTIEDPYYIALTFAEIIKHVINESSDEKNIEFIKQIFNQAFECAVIDYETADECHVQLAILFADLDEVYSEYTQQAIDAIIDYCTQSEAIKQVAIIQAKNDPKEAKETVKQMDESGYDDFEHTAEINRIRNNRAEALKEISIIEATIHGDIETAIETAMSITIQTYQNEALGLIALAQAKNGDMKGPEKTIGMIKGPQYQASAWIGIANHLKSKVGSERSEILKKIRTLLTEARNNIRQMKNKVECLVAILEWYKISQQVQ